MFHDTKKASTRKNDYYKYIRPKLIDALHDKAINE